MKKKAIEKVPYLKPAKPLKAEYTGVTAVKIIKHEKHLIVDVFEKDNKNTPVVRIALTKKDFGTFWPEKGWTRQRVNLGGYCGGEPAWDVNCRNLAKKSMESRNKLESEEDLERIKRWYGKEEPHWVSWTWWDYIHKCETGIVEKENRAKWDRAWKRRSDALHDRIDNTPDLPEGDFIKRAAGTLVHDHIIYYKKHGKRAEIACTACGNRGEYRWKDGISYLSQFESHIPEPKAGKTTKCPMCGAYAEYRCAGIRNGREMETRHVFIAQSYKKAGIVVREIAVEKKWWVTCGEGGSIDEAGEKLGMYECTRTYFLPGQPSHTDYHKCNPYSGENFWDDVNLSSMNPIRIQPGRVVPESYIALNGTEFQYCALEEYIKQSEKVNMVEYLQTYRRYPQIEMLVKRKLKKLVDDLMERNICVNENATRLDEFLRIRAERAKQLTEENCDLGLIRAMRIEKIQNQKWTDEQLEAVREIRLRETDAECILRHMGIQRFLNRVAKYAGCEFGTMCMEAEQRLRSTAITYADYLHMRENLGYDLTNMIYQHPRNLEQAHQQMITEQNAQAFDERVRTKERQFPKIKEQYEAILGYYAYKKDGLAIRPAVSAAEIIREGKELHHCVGGDGYLSKHNRGESYILMLRHEEEPETPYITVEITGKEDKICQWYGAYDKKPDEDQIKEWLKKYLKELKERRKQAIMEQAMQEAAQPVLMPA